MKILKFYADWCGPCKSYAPIFDDFAKNNPDIDTESIDVDKNPDIAGKYNIKSIPMTILIDENGDALDGALGIMTEDKLNVMYNKHK